MAETIREKIIEDIKTTLETITIANSYQNDIQSVQRWKQSGNSLIQVPCIIVNAGPEEKEQRPGLMTSCKLSVMIDLWIRHDENDVPGSTDKLLNSLLGDIEKALMADYQRSNNAVNTRILRNISFEAVEGQPYAGLIIEVEVEYRHKTTDPTQAV